MSAGEGSGPGGGAAASGDCIVSENRVRWKGSEYHLGKMLGRGRFASVWLASAAGQPQLAIKVTELQNLSPWSRGQLGKEIGIWSSLQHPHIVAMHGVLSNATRHCLMLEHAAGGELFDRIVAMQGEYSEAVAMRLLAQIISAVAHLHSFGIAHRDLKPENVLLASSAADAAIKVADLGAAARVSASGATTPCGSMGYAAPEQLRNIKRGRDVAPCSYHCEVDIWAVGVIAYVLLSGSMPFNPSTYLKQELSVSFPDELFAEVSDEGVDFVGALLEPEPSNRLSSERALQHSWLLPGVATLAAEAVPEGLKHLTGSRPPVPIHFEERGAPHPTPSSGSAARHSERTPLPTPGRLSALIASGKLRKHWGAQLLSPTAATQSGGDSSSFHSAKSSSLDEATRRDDGENSHEETTERRNFGQN